MLGVKRLREIICSALLAFSAAAAHAGIPYEELIAQYPQWPLYGLTDITPLGPSHSFMLAVLKGGKTGDGCPNDSCGFLEVEFGQEFIPVHYFDGIVDAGRPVSALARDSAGMMYGFTSNGSNRVTVYRIRQTQPGSESWDFESIADSDNNPALLYTAADQVTLDAAGYIYIPTLSGIVRLTPQPFGSGFWPATVIAPTVADGDITIDPSGVIYADNNNSPFGEIISLTPPKPGKSKWTLKSVYRFTGGADGEYPIGAPVLAPDGTLVGVTSGETSGGTNPCSSGVEGACGTIYTLSNAGKKWKFDVIYSPTADIGDTFYIRPVMAGGTGGYPIRIYEYLDFVGNYGGPTLEMTPSSKKAGSWDVTYMNYQYAHGFNPGGMIADSYTGLGIVESGYYETFATEFPPSIGGPFTISGADTCIKVTFSNVNALAVVDFTNTCSRPVYFWECAGSALSADSVCPDYSYFGTLYLEPGAQTEEAFETFQGWVVVGVARDCPAGSYPDYEQYGVQGSGGQQPKCGLRKPSK